MTGGLAVTTREAATVRLNRAQSGYLDALRGFAAQFVLLQHAFGYCLPNSGLDGYGLGALGVLIFFLLSGFLITDSIRTGVIRGRFTFRDFFVNRVRRIYTAYVPAILFVALLDWFSSRSPAFEYGRDYNLPTAAANLVMLQDFPLFQILRRLHVPDQPWFVSSFGSARQFWTISIEWWIYMLVGLATAMALSRRRSPLLWLVLAAVAIEPAYNFVGGPGDCLTLAWLAGGAAALLFRRVTTGAVLPPGRLGLVALWCVVLLLTALRLFYTHGHLYDAVFAILLAALMVIPLLALGATAGAGIIGTLRLDRLSFHSYSLYLTHGTIVIFLSAFHPELIAGWRGVAFVVLITNAFAVVFAYVFEKQVTGWLRRAAGARVALHPAA